MDDLAVTRPAPATLPRNLPALVLAAGLSSRMGAFKPLLPVRVHPSSDVPAENSPPTRPVIHHLLDSLLRSGRISRILVVTGHRAGELEESLRLHFPSVETCYNPHFASGEMLSSLKAGIAALQAGEPAPDRSFLLALGDQPAVQPETIARLVAAFVNAVAQRPPLVIPAHAGKRGHPLVLSAGLIPAIQALAPGDSLKSVVHQHLAQALLLPVDDPATLEDLDTPADLARARDRWQTSMSADLSSHGDFFSPVMHGDAHG